MSEETADRGIKVILLGEAGVGKTNLIRRAMGLEFDFNSYSTCNSSYSEGNITVNNMKYLYFLWDTAGQEIYRSLNQLFIKESKIIIIVFAINDENSFNQIDFWVDYSKKILGNDDYIFALVANKSDLFLKQEVSDEKIKQKAEELNIKLKITSEAEDRTGFLDFLQELLTDYITKYSPKGIEEIHSFRISGNNNKNKKHTNKKKSKGIFGFFGDCFK